MFYLIGTSKLHKYGVVALRLWVHFLLGTIGILSLSSVLLHLQSLKLKKFGHGLLCCVMQSIRCLKCVLNRYFHDTFWDCLCNSAFTLFIAIIFSFSIKIVIFLSLLFSIACFILYNGHDFSAKQNRVHHMAYWYVWLLVV